MATVQLSNCNWTVEVGKGLFGMVHTFKFANTTEEQALVLLEEDPEGMILRGECKMGFGGDLETVTGMDVGARINSVREGPRPPQQVAVLPGEKVERTMKSATILWSAAFLGYSGESNEAAKTFRIFKQRETMDAGSKCTILQKHTVSPLTQEVEAASFVEALEIARSSTGTRVQGGGKAKLGNEDQVQGNQQEQDGPVKPNVNAKDVTQEATIDNKKEEAVDKKKVADLPGPPGVIDCLALSPPRRMPSRRYSQMPPVPSSPPLPAQSPRASMLGYVAASASGVEPEAELAPEADVSGRWSLLHRPNVQIVVKNNWIESTDGSRQQQLCVGCENTVSVADRGQRIVGKVSKNEVVWSDGITWVRVVPLPAIFMPVYQKVHVLSSATSSWCAATVRGVAVQSGLVQVGQRTVNVDAGSFFIHSSCGESDIIPATEVKQVLKMD